MATRTYNAEYASLTTLVDVTRRRLCLPPERTGEVEARPAPRRRPRTTHPDLGSSGHELLTLWWPGDA